MKTFTFFLILVLALGISVQGQKTIHVPDDYLTIQEGINAAGDGDIVLVDQGIYTENINIYAKAITVTSNYINTLDSADIYNTIIDGSQPSDTTLASVVTFSINSDTNTVICGFTIKNGKGSSSLGNRLGGGIICFDGGKIIHNRIIDNSITADEHALGGGIWLDGLPLSYFVIKDNIIESNQLHNTHSSYMSWGVGIGIYSGNVIIENNIIRSNTAYGRPYGVGIYCNRSNGSISNNLITSNTGYHTLINKSRGVGMYLVNNYSKLTVSNNEITHNQLIPDGNTWNSGGGIAILNTGGFEYDSIVIDKNIISHNTARYGGGIAITEIYSVELSNNVIQNNESGSNGAGICFQDHNKKREYVEIESHIVSNQKEKGTKDIIPVLVNNTITGNISGFNGGGLSMYMDSDYLLFNNIIYDNLDGSGENEIYLTSFSYAFLYNNNINTNEISGSGSWEGDDNIDVDPYFDTDSYHLLAGSECINEGIEIVNHEHTDYYAPGYDIDDEPRPFENFVDIGADEYAEPVSIGQVNNLASISAFIRPNPFTSSTTIEYELNQVSDVRIVIYNHLGKQIEARNYTQQSGKQSIVWNAIDLPSGVYFCVVSTPQHITTNKLVKL